MDDVEGHEVGGDEGSAYGSLRRTGPPLRRSGWITRRLLTEDPPDPTRAIGPQKAMTQ